MTLLGRIRWAALSMLLFLVPVTSEAQRADSSFADLGNRIAPGDRIEVTDREGNSIDGRFVELTTDGLDVSVDGSRRVFGQSEVKTIRRLGHASRLLGGIIGGVGGGLTALGVCRIAGGEEHCGASTAGIFGFYGAVGTGVGIAVASVIPWSEVVFDVGGTATLRVVPIVAPDQRAVRLSFSF